MPHTEVPTPPRPVVLVVDDTDAVRQLLRAGLRHHGFDVRAAGDGREAIAVYDRLREEDEGAIVLLDVQMPGLDGPQVLAALQAIQPAVRVYFMTGDPGRYDEDGLLAMGARGVFRKPFDVAGVAAEFRRGVTAAGRIVPAVASGSGPGHYTEDRR